jgi:predicted dehydrogenase
MLSVGLVGAGPWAQMFTGRMLADSPEVSLECLWARRPEAAQSVAQQLGTSAAASFDELVDRVDAVAFSVAPDAQAELAPRAALAGKHLLLEKPLAFDLKGAQRIADAIEHSGVASLVLLTYRFSPQVREFLQAVDQRRVDYVDVSWLGSGAVAGSPFATPWRQRDRAALLDLGPHAFDLLESAAGPVTSLRARESAGFVNVWTQHANGAMGSLSLSVSVPGSMEPMRAVAVTESNRVTLADPSPALRGDVQRELVRAWIDQIGGVAGRPLPDVTYGLRLQRLLAATTSALEGGVEIHVADER